MKRMTGAEIRESWIKFFESKNHHFIKPASLIPLNDPSLLWINSGISTLKDYFSGKKNPPSPRLVNSQKALRTNDFFNVGLTSRHHTLFEMLGNFSIGDYFKVEAIEFAYELLINKWKIDPSLLWITVFYDDEITYNKWIDLGINKDQIIKCDRDRNFWDVGNGPCGPCTEIYYDRGVKYDPNNIGSKLMIEDIENDRYVEIWNIVFSQFNNDGNNNYLELLRKNIDTGAGLERLACISQDVPTNFDTDLFQSIIKKIEQFSEFKYDINSYFVNDAKQNKINFYYKVIADHLRASVFAIADGAIPSNKDRGYVLRRLLRRAIIMSHRLNITDYEWINESVNAVIDVMQPFYSYLLDEKENIFTIIKNEYKIFNNTLNQGMKIFYEAINQNKLNDDLIFNLVTTYGFPIEIIKEIAEEKNISIDESEFNKRFAEHQKISQNMHRNKALDSQNNSLINLKVPSEFIYEKTNIEAIVVKLFDNDFNEVDKLNGDGYVVFDNTVFYATSGGQNHDTGYINNIYYVDDVIKGPNLQHIHHVNGARLHVGQKVNLQINELDRQLNMAHHSSEHLLQAALINVISSTIKQQGAFKNPQKFTFDFQHPTKLTDEQLQSIENWINDIVAEKIPVEVLHLELQEAKDIGAKAYFEDMYKKIGGKLRVIKIGEKSIELCGGTHAHNTADIEKFSIIDHFSKRAGEWRIEAISTNYNHDRFKNEFNLKIEKYFNDQVTNFKNQDLETNELTKLFDKFKNNIKELPLRNYNLTFNKFQQDVGALKNKLMSNNDENSIIEIKKILNNIDSDKKLLVCENTFNMNVINKALSELINETHNVLYCAIAIENNKLQYLCITNKNSSYNVPELIQSINNISNGKGSGKLNFGRGGTQDVTSLPKIISYLKEIGFNNA